MLIIPSIETMPLRNLFGVFPSTMSATATMSNMAQRTTSFRTLDPEVRRAEANLLATAVAFDPASVTRPDRALLNYYIITAALTVVGFPFAIWPMLFKYRTLKYRFDDKGIAMSWGLLFRREIYLTYRRIQDIHVTRNLIQRWLGLASVAVQTASGAGGAEMTLEGIINPESLRDFLYMKMRGVREDESSHESGLSAALNPQATNDDEVLILLHSIRDELRSLRTRDASNEFRRDAQGRAHEENAT